MPDLLTLVGRVAGREGETQLTPGANGKLVVTLDDGHDVVVNVDASTVDVVASDGGFDWVILAGERVAVRAGITLPGKGAHPVSVLAARIAVAAPGKAAVTDDNRLCALVDDDPKVRLGAQAPELDVPRPKAKPPAGPAPRVGRAPYYRIGAVLAGGGALLAGIAFASWGTRPEPAAIPAGWTGIALLYALCGLIGAAAISAGRVPFELGAGRGKGLAGRPAWAVTGALMALALFLGFPAMISLIERPKNAAVFIAAGCWLCAAAATGFLLFDLYRMRHHHRFALRLLRGAGSSGVVAAGRLDRRVAYHHKARKYTSTVRGKDGNSKFVDRSETWIEGRESTDGDTHLSIRTSDAPLELPTQKLQWSAPLRYLPGTGAEEVVSLTGIAPGDAIMFSADHQLAFAAPARVGATLGIVYGGHLVRVLALALVGGLAAYVALAIGRLS